MKTSTYVPSNFMTNNDVKYFDKMFEEKILDRGGDKILFLDLKDILLNSTKPDKTVLSDSLEKLKKKLKETGGLSDNDLFMCNLYFLTFINSKV